IAYHDRASVAPAKRWLVAARARRYKRTERPGGGARRGGPPPARRPSAGVNDGWGASVLRGILGGVHVQAEGRGRPGRTPPRQPSPGHVSRVSGWAQPVGNSVEDVHGAAAAGAVVVLVAVHARGRAVLAERAGRE